MKKNLFEECKELIQELKETNRFGISVDIDETIANTNYYWADHLINNYCNPECLTAKDIITRYRYCYKVPYWQGEELEWIENEISSSPAKLKIPVIEGSVEGLKSINGLIPIITYITGRPQNTNKGTLKWLKKNSFPKAQILAAPSKVILKQNNISGDKWKALALEMLYPFVWGIIDDNPNIIEQLPHYYKGVIFLYSHNTSHQQRSKNVRYCPTWNDVVKEIKVHWNSIR